MLFTLSIILFIICEIPIFSEKPKKTAITEEDMSK